MQLEAFAFIFWLNPYVLQMNAEAEREMLESQLERAAKENAALTRRLHIAVVSHAVLEPFSHLYVHSSIKNIHLAKEFLPTHLP